MILVDTSVFVRAFMGKSPYQAAVAELLAHDLVLKHEHVYGELLIGDPGSRSRFLVEYAQFTSATHLSNPEVVRFVKERRLHGKGIGWVDAHLLGAALASRAQLYSADAALIALAEEIGVAYAP